MVNMAKLFTRSEDISPKCKTFIQFHWETSATLTYNSINYQAKTSNVYVTLGTFVPHQIVPSDSCSLAVSNGKQ